MTRALQQSTGPSCAYCLTPANRVGVSGQTRVGKPEALQPYIICKDCCGKLHASNFDATQVIKHKKKFWDRVRQNLTKRLQKNEGGL